MKKITLAHKALALPLLGLMLTWSLFMGAAYSDLGLRLQTLQPEVKLSTYLFLLGIAIGTASALVGQGFAQIAVKKEPKLLLPRATLRFTNLTVIIALVAGTVFALGNFLGAFNTYGYRSANVGLRFVGVYLPIILAAAMVIYALLRAFVFNHDDDAKKADGRKGMSETQKALALGYTIPILAAAIAIVFGLLVYDATRTNLAVWVWVIIQSIIGSGVIVGTRFAAKARAAKPAPPKPKTALAAGASNLNFVLSIVFGGVVSIMAFTFGFAAIDKLFSSVWYEDMANNKIEPITLPWLIEDMLPAKTLLLLAVVGIYWSITARNKEVK